MAWTLQRGPKEGPPVLQRKKHSWRSWLVASCFSQEVFIESMVDRCVVFFCLRRLSLVCLSVVVVCASNVSMVACISSSDFLLRCYLVICYLVICQNFWLLKIQENVFGISRQNILNHLAFVLQHYLVGLQHYQPSTQIVDLHVAWCYHRSIVWS